MVDILWSGWRSEYIFNLPAQRSSTDQTQPLSPSIFRRILEAEVSDEDSFIIHRGQQVFAIMNSYPYAVGHFMVLPYRQVAELEALTPEESSELWITVNEAVAVAKTVLAPHGLNIGVNLGAAAGGSINEHLHVHVVPRWHGDNNFLVATAQTKSISEALDVTALRLRRGWQELRTGQ